MAASRRRTREPPNSNREWPPLWDRVAPGAIQTHVLIIGVGHYRHLPGGDGPPVSANREYGLGQLTSPPISARAFASWMLTNYENPKAPLGSLDMLLSENPSAQFALPRGQSATVEPATMANIKIAFKAWLRRCDSHPNNVAIFYFCGHGVWVGGDHLLLAEDYGSDETQPFRTSMNWSQMSLGFRNRLAGLQCCFIDACSNVPDDAIRIVHPGAESLFEVEYPVRRYDPLLVLKASPPGNLAYGIAGEVTYFTDALVQCLQGRGSEPNTIDGNWVVTTSSLSKNITKILNEFGLLVDNEWRGEGDLLVRANTPHVPVVVRFFPPDAIRSAKLKLERERDPSWSRDWVADGDSWNLNDVPIGSYTLTASFTPPKYENVNLYFTVLPPGPVPEAIKLRNL